MNGEDAVAATTTNPDCTDFGPDDCCIDCDGTGLWCDSCLRFGGEPCLRCGSTPTVAGMPLENPKVMARYCADCAFALGGVSSGSYPSREDIGG